MTLKATTKTCYISSKVGKIKKRFEWFVLIGNLSTKNKNAHDATEILIFEIFMVEATGVEPVTFWV